MHESKSKMQLHKVEVSLQAYEKEVKTNSGPPIDWNTFNSDQGKHRNKVIHLKNDDLRNGSLRIFEPCVIKFRENITFHPNESANFFPTEAQMNPSTGYYNKFSYRLGFFTAIAIETTDNVIIDLCGYTLASSHLFALQQRFHSLIELADQPFIPKAGPTDFGSDIRVAKNVWIKNGTLGRTAHHSIHGNGCENIIVSDITFKQYEVAAISLNGCRKILVRNCQCDGNNDQIPVLGSYSGARFCEIFGTTVSKILSGPAYQRLMLENAEFRDAFNYLEWALVDLKKELNDFVKVYTQVKDGLMSPEALKPFNPYYNGVYKDNHVYTGFSGIPDGNAYGIAIHSRGPFVNSFNCPGDSFENINDIAKALETTDIVIERTNISNTRGNVREVLALSKLAPGEKPVHDISGAIFHFFDTFDGQVGNLNLESGKPKLTNLGKAQIALAQIQFMLKKYKSEVAGFPGFHQLGFLLGRSNIPYEIMQWAMGVGTLKQREDLPRLFDYSVNGQTKCSFEVLSNGDTMHHVNKGCIGLFIQSVDGLHLDNVIISGVENKGYQGSDLAGKYTGAADGGHKSQGKILGYSGADSRGIYIGASSDINIDDVKIFSVFSKFGSSTGLELANGNHKSEIRNPIVANCMAGTHYLDKKNYIAEMPNKPAKSIGILIARANTLAKIIHPKFSGTFRQPWLEDTNVIQVNSVDTEISSK